jgi:hypothetical protein
VQCCSQPAGGGAPGDNAKEIKQSNTTT